MLKLYEIDSNYIQPTKNVFLSVSLSIARMMYKTEVCNSGRMKLTQKYTLNEIKISYLSVVVFLRCSVVVLIRNTIRDLGR